MAGLRATRPALFTRMSTPPDRSATRANASFHGRLAGDVDAKPVSFLDVEHRHVRSGLLEHACGRRANALRATRDDGNFSVEVEEIHQRSLLATSSTTDVRLERAWIAASVNHRHERAGDAGRGRAPASPAGPSPVHVLFGPRTGRGSPAAGPAAVSGNSS